MSVRELSPSSWCAAGSVVLGKRSRSADGNWWKAYGEWGVSGSIGLNPDASGGGSRSASAPPGARRQAVRTGCGSARDARGLVPDGTFEAERRLAGELGYGLVLPGGFTGTPNLGFGLSDTARDWRVGWRLREPGAAVLLDLDAARREAAVDGAQPEHGVMPRGALRW